MRLAIEFGGTNFKMGLVEENGNILKQKNIPLRDLLGGGNILDHILNIIEEFIESKDIKCGGISSKGLVDHENGVVLDDVGEGKLIKNIPLGKILSKKYAVPFVMDNDARCYAWGEWRFLQEKDINNLTVVTFGTGIGCASVFDGKMLYGTDHLSGIMGGHISICKNGPKCYCGNYGCFEQYCSKNGLMRILSSKDLYLGDVDPIKLFFQRVREKHNGLENSIFEDFLKNLSIGLTNIIHAYGPDLIILGGGIMRSADLIINKITKTVDKMAFTVPKGRVKIIQSSLGDKAPLLGAAFHPKLEKINGYTI